MDLKLTPYKVLATSTKHGQYCFTSCVQNKPMSQSSHMGEFHFTLDAYDLSAGFMQFVQSVPVAEVLATEGNIQVMQYIKSCPILLLESHHPAKFSSNFN